MQALWSWYTWSRGWVGQPGEKVCEGAELAPSVLSATFVLSIHLIFIDCDKFADAVGIFVTLVCTTGFPRLASAGRVAVDTSTTATWRNS